MQIFLMPEFTLILPELFIALASLVLLLEGVFREKLVANYAYRLTQNAALVLLIAVVILLVTQPGEEGGITFNGLFIVNGYTTFCKALVLLGGAGVLVISLDGLEKDNLNHFEFPALVLLSTLGMMLMISANDFISLFIGLELQSLALYVLVAMNRDCLNSSEAGLKYFILGALSTGFFLYGASLIYGFSGSTNFDTLGAVLNYGKEGALNAGVFIGLVFVLATLAFKISAVPFHMWTPDVYQGTPTPVTAFLATTPKIAAMALLVRLMMGPFAQLIVEWHYVLLSLAAASMILGSLAALRQTDIKRMLAYSSIGHMGYALMGIASGNVESVLTYLVVYLVMTLGVFACLLSLKGASQPFVKDIDELAGLSLKHPRMAFILSLFMFSMAGIPPLAGFFAKFYVFLAAIDSGFYAIAIIGALSSVVAAFYYLRIVKVIYFDQPSQALTHCEGGILLVSPARSVVVNITALVIMLFFLFPNALINGATVAAFSMRP